MIDLLKLVKYDWKRNAGSLLIAGVLFVLASAGFIVYSALNDLDKDFIYVMIFLVYLAATISLCITICRTYERNLRYYNRRLLPLPALYTVLSPLLLGIAGIIVIGIVGVLHLNVLGAMLDAPFLRVSDVLANRGFWAMLMSSILFVIIIFTSITVSKVFSGKKGSWIGAALFIGLQLVLQWLETRLFPNMNVSTDQFFQNINVRVTDSPEVVMHVQASFPNFWGPLLFEAVIMIGLIYGMTYLINRKIQVKG